MNFSEGHYCFSTLSQIAQRIPNIPEDSENKVNVRPSGNIPVEGSGKGSGKVLLDRSKCLLRSRRCHRKLLLIASKFF